MKRILIYLPILLLLSLFGASAQSWPEISGIGINLGSFVEPGQSYTYTIKYQKGTMPSQYASLVKWDVENGVIKSVNSAKSSVTVVWNSGVTQGTIKASDVYDATIQPTFKELSSRVDIITSAEDITLNFSLSKDVVYINEKFDVIVSTNAGKGYRVSYSGNDLSTEFVNNDSKHIRGYFASIGHKVVVVKILKDTIGYREVCSVSKDMMVLPTISGPNVIKWNETQNYSIANLPVGVTIKSWEVSNNLSIKSGQGTSAITVSVNQNLASTGFIKLNMIHNGQVYTVQNNVTVFIPVIESISGPTSAQIGKTYVYSVYPQYPSSNDYKYEWTVTGGSASVGYAPRPSTDITFKEAGNYFVKCNLALYIDGKYIYPSTHVAMWVQVIRYLVSSGTFGQISISDTYSSTSNEISTYSLNRLSLVDYEVYSSTGSLISKGEYDVNQGVMNLNTLPKGNYVLKIQAKNNYYESHKIIVR